MDARRAAYKDSVLKYVKSTQAKSPYKHGYRRDNMQWETLPGWFWEIYYLFFLITAGTAVFRLARSKSRRMSVAAMLLALVIPLVSLWNSIGRAEGTNEYEHFVMELLQGSLWALFVFAGYVFLFAWWAMLLRNKKPSVQ